MAHPITTFLSFDGHAEAATRFYTELFPGGKIHSLKPLGTPGDGAGEGNIVATFEIFGGRFLALDVGPMFTPSPAISLMVHCATQDEIDRYWDALCDGGAPMACGWVTDRFGVTWQIVPESLEWLTDGSDPDGTARVMQALTRMVKLDKAVLEAAYRGEPA